jgi:hypothetical protein
MPILASFILTASLAVPPSPQPAATAGDCPEDIRPAQFPAPALPPILHNEFEGRVVLAFDILPSGEVHAPTIESASWQPVGNSRGEPEGYDAAILAAIAQWRYPPQPATCRMTLPLEFVYE